MLAIIFATVVIYLLWKICNRYYGKSCLDHIPGPRCTSLLLAGFSGITSRDGWSFMNDLANGYGGVVRLRDMFGNKIAYVTDPVALSSIVGKDHHLYEEPYEFLLASRLLFGPGILSVVGDVHRRQRRLMNPTFSTGNLRYLTPVLANIGDTFRTAIQGQVKDDPRDIDMSKWVARVILEMTGRAVLDYSFDSLVEETENEYASAIKDAFPTLFAVPLHFVFILTWAKVFGITQIPSWIAKVYPSAKVQRAKKTWDMLWTQAERLVEEKMNVVTLTDKSALQEDGKVAYGKDVLTTLLEANVSAQPEDRLTREEIIASVNTVIFGAVESTANMVSRILHTLALHPDAQERLSREIVAASEAGASLTYEHVMELPFLDAVYQETARAYPPVHVMNRELTEEKAILPLGRPLEDVSGRLVNEIVLEKGVTVAIGIHGYNTSKAVWGDDATEWKPERWLSSEAPPEVPCGGIYSNTMTFLGGPRSCIGFKYAEVQIKMTLYHLLQSFTFSLGQEEVVWNTSRIIFPSTARGGADSTSMPLRVEAIGRRSD